MGGLEELMKNLLSIVATMFIIAYSAHGQVSVVGRVCDGDTKQGIPFAALHLRNTSIATFCNESGRFELQVPSSIAEFQVVVSSIGYLSDTLSITMLQQKNGNVRLQPEVVMLQNVDVFAERSARSLLEEVWKKIPGNYRTQEAVGIWHFRNRQMLNNRMYVKSEGLIRNYMIPCGQSVRLRYHSDKDKQAEEKYRIYQSLDSVLLFDALYWRLMVGRSKLDTLLALETYAKPSDHLYAIGSDFVSYWKRCKRALFPPNATYTMRTISYEGRETYQVVVGLPQKDGIPDTITLIISKDDLAVLDATQHTHTREYIPGNDMMSKRFYDSRTYWSKQHWRYHKYNDKYQRDFIQREFEDTFIFSQAAIDKGCNSPTIVIHCKEECILSEHSYDVADYKRRYVNNKQAKNRENVEETERILSQPHNKIPW